MRGWLALALVSVVSLAAADSATAATRPVTVYLERHGKTVSSSVTIPAYGGGTVRWNQITACVAQHFAPFQIDVVDEKPRGGDYITVVVGGWASQLGLSNATTNGVGPYNGGVIRNATVYVFSKVGTGEKDVGNLCAVAAHEAAHAMGLDHTYKCGDIMSYFLDRCGTRKFLDVDAHCGESQARYCANGDASQNSYRRLGQLVGFRVQPDEPDRPDDDTDDTESIWDDEPADSDEDAVHADDEVEAEPEPPRQPHCGGHSQTRVIYRYRIVRRY